MQSLYVYTGGEKKDKKTSKPYKVVMREHEGENSLFVIIKSKDNNQAFREAENYI